MYSALIPCFIIDQTALHTNFSISEDGTTATKMSNGYATFRASKPLSQASCRWAVRMVKESATCVGLLPKLSANPVGGKCVYDLGGWCIWDDGIAFGDWQCEDGMVTFTEGDLVTLDFSFAAKTLTISCNGKTVVGHIPSIKEGDELYPAVGTRQGAASEEIRVVEAEGKEAIKARKDLLVTMGEMRARAEALKEERLVLDVMQQCIDDYTNAPASLTKAAAQELAADATRKYKSPLFNRQKVLLADIKKHKKDFLAKKASE
eukprot:GILI01006878.1.p1 GENE.GILI01006878.1~~GILI01006878.1.p1  ORF type:complete len:262 (+),score=57.99 GILI01006878.1:3-788(+)